MNHSSQNEFIHLRDEKSPLEQNVTRQNENNSTSDHKRREHLVTNGTLNYPGYLKLIYTSETDFSSDDEVDFDFLRDVGESKKKKKDAKDGRVRDSTVDGGCLAPPEWGMSLVVSFCVVIL